MSDREALLRTIFENPDDDAPRLVYADWLDENKDALQAAFIRVQVDLAKLGRDNPRERELRTRERELWRTVSRWRFLPRRWAVATLEMFRRGFFAYWRGTVGDFLAEAAELWRDGPPESGLIYAEFQRDAARLPVLAKCPALACFRRLTLAGDSLDDAGVRGLLGSECLYRLRSLHVGGDLVTDETAALLATSPLARSLRELKVYSASLTDRSSQELGRAFAERVEVRFEVRPHWMWNDLP
jgi:uncharacterized protein (TIGR02996 family)